jgi:hypothetical protein
MQSRSSTTLTTLHPVENHPTGCHYCLTNDAKFISFFKFESIQKLRNLGVVARSTNTLEYRLQSEPSIFKRRLTLGYSIGIHRRTKFARYGKNLKTVSGPHQPVVYTLRTAISGLACQMATDRASLLLTFK